MSVAIDNLIKEFDDPSGKRVRAVDGVSMEIKPGEMVTFLGPSGCGKTTTLRMIAGFEDPTSGKIAINGRDVTREPAHLRNTPMVFQSYALFPHLSVRENAAFGLVMRGVEKASARARVDEMGKAMGLAEYLDRSPHQLSGGQQQRVALLRALVTEPKVLLFDEPLSNLDAQMRVAMRAEIRRIQKKSGFTAVYVTHDQDEAMVLSDRVVIMNKGRIAQIGSPRDIYERPASRFVAQFIGEANFIACDVVAREAGSLVVDGPLGRLTVPDRPHLGDARSVTLVVRPEHVKLFDKAAQKRGKVRSTVYLGAEARYEIDVGGTLIDARVYNPVDDALFAEGAELPVTVDTRSVHPLAGTGE